MKCALVSLLLGAAGAAQETTAPARAIDTRHGEFMIPRYSPTPEP